MRRKRQYVHRGKRGFGWGMLLAALLVGMLLSRTTLGDCLWRLTLTSMAGADIRDPASVLKSVFGNSTVVHAADDEEIYIGLEQQPLDIRIIPPVQAPVEAPRAGPKILVYHTHTTEAYTMTPQQSYVETDTWRTNDQEHNIVKIGDLLTRQLQAYGAQVWHATTNHEPPNMRTAYTRSLLTMQAALEEEPGISLFIDVHRDAYIEGNKEAQNAILNGQEVARIMFVVGMATDSDYNGLPDWQKNYALAKDITHKINQKYPGLAKEPMLRTARYNQHMGLCLLLEVGNNVNTLEQAMAVIGPVAWGISQCVPGFEGAQQDGAWGALVPKG
nr:stage II sporulation protein P [bacterium]